MKRLLSILLAVALFMIPCSAMAFSWEGNVKPDASLYDVTIEKYAIQHDVTGYSRFYPAPSGTISAGGSVFFALKLTVPAESELVSAYGNDPGADGASIKIKLSEMVPVTVTGITRNFVEEVRLPEATDSTQILYLNPDGAWCASVREALWCGYAQTNAPSVTASLQYDYSLSQITVQNGFDYYQVATASDGYTFYNNDSALHFHTDNSGKVVRTTLELGGASYALYQSRTGFGVEGDTGYGFYGNIVAHYLLALGIDADMLFNESIYMTAQNIRANFGPAVMVTGSASWAPQVVVPTEPVIEIPQTGDVPTSLAAIICFIGAGVLMFYVIWVKTQRTGKTV